MATIKQQIEAAEKDLLNKVIPLLDKFREETGLQIWKIESEVTITVEDGTDDAEISDRHVNYKIVYSETSRY